MADVDLSKLTLRQLRGRLASPTPGAEQLSEALVAAVADTLLLRELAVLGIRPRVGESRRVAIERLAAQVYAPENHCGGVSQADLKLAYMSQLTRFKHPASWTLWTAIVADAALAKTLHRTLRRRLPVAPSLPAETTCTGPGGPVEVSHAKPFEAAVADMADASTQVQLRRYTFYDQRDPQIPPGHFRATSAEVAAAVKDVPIGGLIGPVTAADGHHVILVVCRDKRRYDALEAPATQRALRRQLCQGAADTARKEHLERLLKGAAIRWRRDTLRAVFGEAALQKLPPDVTTRQRPIVPH